MSKEVLRPIDVPYLKQLGMFVMGMVGLYSVYMLTVVNPNIVVRDGQIIFGAVLGAAVFITVLAFIKNIKQFKKTQTSLGK
jgi:hypothetical protein